MRSFAFACVAACVAVASTSLVEVEAQETAPAAAPEATPLPPVVVETADQKTKKAKAKPKKKGSSVASAPATPQATAPVEQPTGPGNSNASDKTATGPVRDYNAKNTATGTKTDTPLSEIPQSVSVVGAEQIRDQGAQNVQEALRYVPGVVADAYGVDGRADGHFIRGTPATDYLDGLKRTYGYYTYTYRVDPFMMERIEVLKGPASVLYGQAPVGGIVNYVSKRPQSETGGEISVDYGSFDFKQVRFDMTGPVSSDPRWSYRLTGVARDAGTQIDNVDNDRTAIQPALTFRPDKDTAITVIGEFQRDRMGQVSQFFPIIGTLYPNVDGKKIARSTFIGDKNDHYDTDANSATLLVEHNFAPWLKFQHSSRYSDVHNEYLGTYGYPWLYALNAVPPNMPNPVYVPDPTEQYLNRVRGLMVTDTQMFNQDTNLEAKFGTGIVQHRVIGGVDYSHFTARQGQNNTYDLSPINVYDPGSHTSVWAGYDCSGALIVGYNNPQICSTSNQQVAQTGLYIQDQMRLGNWIAVVGTRKDWIENSADGTDTQRDEAVTYRAGLMYEFASGLTPYVSYSESFVPVVGTGRLGQTFKPNEGRMYEAGFKYAPRGANFAVNGSVYDLTENNYLATDPVNPNFSIQTGGIAVKGVELELTGKLTENLKVVGGYSYTQAQYDDGSAADGNQIESIPKHLASLWGVWEFDQPQLKGWSVGAGARYIGTSWDSTNTVEVPNVTLFDAMVAYEEQHWRWQLSGTNLEDKYYISTCLSRGDCWIGNARTIMTTLTYKY